MKKEEKKRLMGKEKLMADMTQLSQEIKTIITKYDVSVFNQLATISIVFSDFMDIFLEKISATKEDAFLKDIIKIHALNNDLKEIVEKCDKIERGKVCYVVKECEECEEKQKEENNND